MAVTAPTNQPTIVTVAGPETVISSTTPQAAQIVSAAPEAAQIVSVALQGPPGPPGPAANQVTIPAGATVSADTAVAVVNGAVVPAQSGVTAHFGNVVGIAVNGGSAGTNIVIQQSGEMTLSSWNWT